MASKLLCRFFCTRGKNKVQKKTDKDLLRMMKKKKKKSDYKETVEEVIVDCQKRKLKRVEFRPPKRVNVSLQCANSRAGRFGTLLLKQSPFLKKIYIHDTTSMEHFEYDLNMVDTSAKIKSYHHKDMEEYSLRAADIVVIMDSDSKYLTDAEKFKFNFSKVLKIAQYCCEHCPRAVIIVAAQPICCMVPLVYHVFEGTPWSHPSKLLGCISKLQCAFNSSAAKFLSLNNSSVHVPLLGGPTLSSIVPIISHMIPNPAFSVEEEIRFYKMLKKDVRERVKNFKPGATAIEGYAIAKMVTTVAKGLCGKDDGRATAFVRTNIAPQVRHLVTSVQFGLNGVYNNYGLPKLSHFEMDELLCAMAEVNDSDKRVQHAIKAHYAKENLQCCG